jgi:hypothetical protein
MQVIVAAGGKQLCARYCSTVTVHRQHASLSRFAECVGWLTAVLAWLYSFTLAALLHAHHRMKQT